MVHWHNRMHAILRKHENLKFAIYLEGIIKQNESEEG